MIVERRGVFVGTYGIGRPQNVCHVIIRIRQNLRWGCQGLDAGSDSTSRVLLEGNEHAGKGEN